LYCAVEDPPYTLLEYLESWNKDMQQTRQKVLSQVVTNLKATLLSLARLAGIYFPEGALHFRDIGIEFSKQYE